MAGKRRYQTAMRVTATQTKTRPPLQPIRLPCLDFQLKSDPMQRDETDPSRQQTLIPMTSAHHQGNEHLSFVTGGPTNLKHRENTSLRIKMASVVAHTKTTIQLLGRCQMQLHPSQHTNLLRLHCSQHKWLRRRWKRATTMTVDLTSPRAQTIDLRRKVCAGDPHPSLLVHRARSTLRTLAVITATHTPSANGIATENAIVTQMLRTPMQVTLDTAATPQKTRHIHGSEIVTRPLERAATTEPKTSGKTGTLVAIGRRKLTGTTTTARESTVGTQIAIEEGTGMLLAAYRMEWAGGDMRCEWSLLKSRAQVQRAHREDVDRVLSLGFGDDGGLRECGEAKL
jgi:hypothetical protein